MIRRYEVEFIQRYRDLCEEYEMLVEGEAIVGASMKDVDRHIDVLKESILNN